MSPVGDEGGEADLSHVLSGGCSVTRVPSGGRGRTGGSLPGTQWGALNDICFLGGMGGKEGDLCHVHSGGCSVTHVPNVEWGRRGDLSHIRSGDCSVKHVPSGGYIGEEDLAMYAVGDTCP